MKNNHKPQYDKGTGKSPDTEEQQQPKIDTQLEKNYNLEARIQEICSLGQVGT